MSKHRAPAILNQTFIPCLKSEPNSGRLVGGESATELFLIGNLNHPSSAVTFRSSAFCVVLEANTCVLGKAGSF